MPAAVQGKLFGAEVQRGLIWLTSQRRKRGLRARLNDTPNIVALLLVIKTFDVKFGMLLVTVAIAIGGC